MNQPDSNALLERQIFRYVRALDAGNLDEIAAVLRLAEEDAQLERILEEVNLAFADELGLSSTALDGEQVRALLQGHFPSAFQEAGEIPPITVGEVTARLLAERLIPPADLETSRKLLRQQIPVPDWLSLSEIRKLIAQLSLQVSDRFMKAFRDAAIQMSMGRGQAQMAATRRKYARRPNNSEDISDKEAHD